MKEQIWSKLQQVQQRIDQIGIQVMNRLPAEVSARNVLIFCLLSLICIGTVMVASASMPYAERIYDNPNHFIFRHLAYLVFASVALTVAYHIPLKYWFGKMTIILWIGTIILLTAVLVTGRDINGSARWINIAGFTFQPSEVAKFTMAVFTADYVVRRAGEVRENFLSFVRLCIPVGSTVTLIMIEPDLGASAVVVGTMVAVFFLAGASGRAFLLLFGALAMALITFIVLEPYRLQRVKSFTNPWDDIQGTGYQLAQSLIAFGRGEWTGTGLGQSVQKLAYLPEAHTDFMLAVAGEELGFIGITTIFTLSFLMVAACMRIGYRALANQHLRSGYLAYGIAVIFLLQICVNGGMNLGLLPTKGLTLPFISYGGSSLLVCAFMIGVMFKIDRDTCDKNKANLT